MLTFKFLKIHIRQFNIILLSCILSFYGCKSNTTADDLKAVFYKHKSKLDSFVIATQKDKSLDSILSNRTQQQGWTFSDIETTYPKVYKLLDDAGITEASGHRHSRTRKWYFLKTNWRNDYPIYLTYDAFDSVQTNNGFYEKDEVSNETWGLGDHWLMFRWVKDKPYKQ